jgi:hypothetical protein
MVAADVHVLNSHERQVEVQHPQQERDRGAEDVNRHSPGRARDANIEGRLFVALVQEAIDLGPEDSDQG